MSEHRVTVKWARESEDFTYQTYNRDHDWIFSDTQQVRASAAPDYLGNPDLADPEQTFVAALSSCHMLTFLAQAAKRKFVVDEYIDNASGLLEKNESGQLAITRVILRPRITFAADVDPTDDELEKLHAAAHRYCFLANSVKTEISVA